MTFTGRAGAAIWAAATLAVLVAAAAIIRISPAVSFGDGSEYYAMFYAWFDTLRPWMSEKSFQAYQRFHELSGVAGTYDVDYLRSLFPQLRVGNTADFNHFWLYSLLAAVVHKAFGAFGISLGAHGSFAVLHLLFLAGLLAVAALCHGWKGFVVALLFVAGSPILPYLNKVHTEFVTFCVTVAAIALVMRNQLVAGAVLMAVAATQNPGLSFVPVVMLGLRTLGGWKDRYSQWEVIGVVAAILLLALHPAYYFLRYGVATPQLLAGGANLGGGLSTSYIWLIDPDIGLFPHWPLGLLMLVCGAIVWRWARQGQVDAPANLWIICAVFLAAALYSHGSTTNINSGSASGPSRYALWYIALIYPFGVICAEALSSASLAYRATATAITAGLFGITAIANFRYSLPDYVQPTPLSYALQSKLPGLYDPPSEVFAERYSGFGEGQYAVRAVVGPDCHKTLIVPDAPAGATITVPASCGFLPSQISDLVTLKSGTGKAPSYLTLTEDDVSEPAQSSMRPGQKYSHDAASAPFRLTGWSLAEKTLVWSRGRQSSLKLLVDPTDPTARCLTLYGAPFGRQPIEASVNGAMAARATMDSEGQITVPLGAARGYIDVTLAFSAPQTPAGDTRLLAFALRALKVDACGVDLPT